MLSPTLTLRAPRTADGAAMWRLVRDSGVLDLNSPYCYLMLATRFAETSVVADQDGEVVGFVAGYRPPDEPDAVFVWQVGVDAAQRGKGLATRMLHWLVEHTRTAGVTHLEATVAPSNTASQRLFRGLARDLDVDCDERVWLTSDDFPEDGHEAEELFRIGPFS